MSFAEAISHYDDSVKVSTYLLGRLVKHFALRRQCVGTLHQIVQFLSSFQHRLDGLMLNSQQAARGNDMCLRTNTILVSSSSC